jgi:hypothetical protein
MEARTQTFKYGAVVTFDTNGFVKEAVPADSLFLGITMEDAHNITAAQEGAVEIPVIPFTAESLIEINLQSGQNITQADLASATGFNLSGGGANPWTIDRSSGSSAAIRIVKFVDAVGEAQGRVLGVIKGSKRFTNFA